MVVLRFLGSTVGRMARVVVGLALIGVGLAIGDGWIALAVVGVLPLAAGVLDFCLLGPLFQLPLGAKAFRARCEMS